MKLLEQTLNHLKLLSVNNDLVLKVENLSVSFMKGVNILANVSFEIKKGQIVSLIGLNGTGKTTLLKAIVGLVKSSSGSVESFGSKIFYVPQRTDLNMSFPLSVKEFCDLFGEEGYEKYLEDLGAKKLLKARVSSLSGGEYQKVQIAIALSRKPDLLLLDEVTAGIDVAGEEQFYELVLRMRKEYGVAIVVVSHNIHLVIKNADQVLCLAGHICCSGKPSDVQDDAAFKEVFGQYLQPYVHKHDHVH